jgi:hypothetical protein
VVHVHPKVLTWAGQPLAIDGTPNSAGAVNGGMPGGAASTANTASAEALIVLVALTVSSGHGGWSPIVLVPHEVA